MRKFMSFIFVALLSPNVLAQHPCSQADVDRANQLLKAASEIGINSPFQYKRLQLNILNVKFCAGLVKKEDYCKEKIPVLDQLITVRTAELLQGTVSSDQVIDLYDDLIELRKTCI